MLKGIKYALAVDILLIGNGMEHKNDRILQSVRGAYGLAPRYTYMSSKTKHKEIQEID